MEDLFIIYQRVWKSYNASFFPWTKEWFGELACEWYAAWDLIEFDMVILSVLQIPYSIAFRDKVYFYTHENKNNRYWHRIKSSEVGVKSLSLHSAEQKVDIDTEISLHKMWLTLDLSMKATK